ncbi:MAG: M20/M25/M40 family metallo-hydrolase [Planctomycetota bacterium]|nr:M20/M25/M40 family metallo-hydrolase [Planctomycetota bacterium]
MKFRQLSILAILATPGIVAESPFAQILSHQMEVTIEPSQSSLAVVDNVLIRTVRRAEKYRFYLSPNLEVSNILMDEKGVSFQRVQENGESLLEVQVGRQKRRDVELVWIYSGDIKAPVKGEGSLSFVRGEESEGRITEEGVYLAPQSGWYPDHPESLASFDLKVSLPEPFVAVSQGRLAERRAADGREISVWEATAEADGLVLVANKFKSSGRKLDGIDVSAFFLEEDIDKAGMFLDAASKYIATYSGLLGSYPYTRFDIVQNFFSTGHGMPAFTLLGPYVIKRGQASLMPGYLDHEIVHCWWGNYVFVSLDKGNWCEALTSYWTNYYQRELAGDAAGAAEYRKLASLKYAVHVSAEQDYPLRQFRTKRNAADGEIGYGKGSMFFHVLRRRVGDEGFQAGMKRLVREFGGRRASWDDIRQAVEKESGLRLSGLFDSWLDAKGAPDFGFGKIELREKSGRYRIKGNLLRKAGGQEADVPVVLTTVSGKEEASVRLGKGSAMFGFETDSLPLHVEIDPEFHVFKTIPEKERAPCLNILLSQQPTLVVDTSNKQSPYFQLASMLTQQGGKQPLKIVDFDDADLDVGSLLLLGETKQVSKLVGRASGTSKPNARAPSGTDLEFIAGTFTVGGKAFEENSALLSVWRNPLNQNALVGCYTGQSDDSVARFRYVFYYGWDSYVVFQDGRPILRGNFETEANSRRQSFASALSGSFDSQSIMTTVEMLAGRNRFPDTSDSRLLRTYLGAKLASSGLSGIDGVHSHDFTVKLATLQEQEAEWKKKRPDFPGFLKSNFSADSPAQTFIRPPDITGTNLFGLLRAEHQEADDKVIVLGAHYDSLGMDDAGRFYPGADDNASGVAALLAIAEALSKQRAQLRHSVLFVLFDFEEWGQLGSKHFVKNSPVPVRSMAGMLNLDAIGAGPRGKAYLIGSSYYPGFAAATRSFLKGLGIQEGKNIDKFAYSGSDHFPFHEAGVPALDFWAGSYGTMNTLLDVIKDVNPDHLHDMTRLGYLTMLNLATRRNLDLSSPSKK